MSGLSPGDLVLFLGWGIETYRLDDPKKETVERAFVPAQEARVVAPYELGDLRCGQHGDQDLYEVEVYTRTHSFCACRCQLMPLEGFEPRADELTEKERTHG